MNTFVSCGHSSRTKQLGHILKKFKRILLLQQSIAEGSISTYSKISGDCFVDVQGGDVSLNLKWKRRPGGHDCSKLAADLVSTNFLRVPHENKVWLFAIECWCIVYIKLEKYCWIQTSSYVSRDAFSKVSCSSNIVVWENDARTHCKPEGEFKDTLTP